MIPAEAVEAAAQAWLERSGKPGAWSLEEEVRAALEAAAPYMMAQALEDAAAVAATKQGSITGSELATWLRAFSVRGHS